jgi:hypothetical protein
MHFLCAASSASQICPAYLMVPLQVRNRWIERLDWTYWTGRAKQKRQLVQQPQDQLARSSLSPKRLCTSQKLTRMASPDILKE